MKTKLSLLLSIVLISSLLTAVPCLLRAESPPAKTAPSFVGDKTYAPTDLEVLRAKLGQVVTIEGNISRAGESKTKTVRYLNFTSDFSKGVTLVFFASAVPDASLDELNKWVGRKVRITGTLEEYNNGLQIKVGKLSELKEIQ